MVAPLLAAVVRQAGKKTVKKAAKKVTKSEVQAAAKARKSMKNTLNKLNAKIEAGEYSGERMQAAKNLKTSLEQNIQDTYMIKKGEKRGEYINSSSRMERTANYAKEVVDSGISSELLRKNEMFRRDVNQASIGGVSTRTKEEVKIFFAMSQEAWEGYDITQRYQKVQEFFGEESLDQIWRKLMSDPNAIRAVERARQAQEKAKSSADVSDGSNDETDEKGSPDYIKELIAALDTARTRAKYNE